MKRILIFAVISLVALGSAAQPAKRRAEAEQKAKAAYLHEAEDKARKALEKKNERARAKAGEQPAQPNLFGDLFNQ